MILYLDTSALVKLYVQEAHSALVLQAVHRAEAVASHWLAYVETYAAFSRLSREGVLNMAQIEKLEERFEMDRTYALTIARNCGLRYSLPQIKLLTKAATTSLNKLRFQA